jgi:hypothetical protein
MPRAPALRLVAQQRRLSDPRLAAHDERTAALVDRLDQVIESAHLGLAPEQ